MDVGLESMAFKNSAIVGEG